MKKFDLRNARKETTMFLSDANIEAKYEAKIKASIKEMQSQLHGLESIEAFENLLRNNKHAIEQIVTLLGISSEKFKRVISWIRLSKGYTFDSEWDYSALRTQILERRDFLELIYELITIGYKSIKFTSIVPQFILSDFRLDGSAFKRLESEDYLRKLVKAKMTNAYNGEYCSLYYNLLYEAINAICNEKNVVYKHHFDIPDTNIKDVDVIENDGNKYIIVNSHFYLTTSSAQTKYAEKITKMRSLLQGNEDVLMVNILDGAGWIGRAADFIKIYYDCDYFLNLKTIRELDTIIEDFLIK